jgi:hypothetical protein
MGIPVPELLEENELQFSKGEENAASMGFRLTVVLFNAWKRGARTGCRRIPTLKPFLYFIYQ